MAAMQPKGEMPLPSGESARMASLYKMTETSTWLSYRKSQGSIIALSQAHDCYICNLAKAAGLKSFYKLCPCESLLDQALLLLPLRAAAPRRF